jgi:ribonuclease inhibitor
VAAKQYALDFSSCRTWEDVHGQIRENLGLPSWYGENADALWDSLTGIIEIPATIHVRFQPEKGFPADVREEIERLLDTFEEAANLSWTGLTVEILR